MDGTSVSEDKKAQIKHLIEEIEQSSVVADAFVADLLLDLTGKRRDLAA